MAGQPWGTHGRVDVGVVKVMRTKYLAAVDAVPAVRRQTDPTDPDVALWKPLM